MKRRKKIGSLRCRFEATSTDTTILELSEKENRCLLFARCKLLLCHNIQIRCRSRSFNRWELNKLQVWIIQKTAPIRLNLLHPIGSSQIRQNYRKRQQLKKSSWSARSMTYRYAKRRMKARKASYSRTQNRVLLTSSSIQVTQMSFRFWIVQESSKLMDNKLRSWC